LKLFKRLNVGKIDKKKLIAGSVFLVIVLAAVTLGLILKYRAASKNPAQVNSTSTAAPTEISPEVKAFGLKIDKISLLAPIVKDVDGNNKDQYLKELVKGLAHFKGTALPREVGNLFIFGHSSSAVGQGPYSEIFAKLNDLEKDDKMTVYYQSKEFTYVVTSKKVVKSDDLAVLNPTSKPTLTLMTCWPIGTNLKRLVVSAKLE